MAFAYMGERKSKYGSWGHLENLGQIGGNYMSIAPKYKALLDANSTKTTARMNANENLEVVFDGYVSIYPNPAKDVLYIDGLLEESTIQIVSFDGRIISSTKVAAGVASLSLSQFNTGLHIVRVQNGVQGTINRKVVIE
jgi:hypothetical protein